MRSVSGAQATCDTSNTFFQLSGCLPLAHRFFAGELIVGGGDSADCDASLAFTKDANTALRVSACDVTCTPSGTAARGTTCNFTTSTVHPYYVVTLSSSLGTYQLASSSPVCSRNDTCSDGLQGAAEEGVDCGGVCASSAPCVFVTESFCGIEFDLSLVDTAAATVEITVRGGGLLQHAAGDFQILVVDNTGSSTGDVDVVAGTASDSDGTAAATSSLTLLPASDVAAVIVSDAEVTVTLSNFRSAYLGVVEVRVVRVTTTQATPGVKGDTAQTVQVTVVDATAVATVFARAPVVLGTPGNAISSSAVDFTITGTGFDTRNCQGHTVKLSPPAGCGTAAGRAGTNCTASTLQVILTELSSRNTGALSAMVRGAAWRGVAWRGVAWRGMAWRGVAWRGMAWRGVAWRGVESNERTPVCLFFCACSAAAPPSSPPLRPSAPAALWSSFSSVRCSRKTP